jgi:hypothetical protein
LFLFHLIFLNYQPIRDLMSSQPMLVSGLWRRVEL